MGGWGGVVEWVTACVRVCGGWWGGGEARVCVCVGVGGWVSGGRAPTESLVHAHPIRIHTQTHTHDTGLTPNTNCAQA